MEANWKRFKARRKSHMQRASITAWAAQNCEMPPLASGSSDYASWTLPSVRARGDDEAAKRQP
jgi:hypothetical protein